MDEGQMLERHGIAGRLQLGGYRDIDVGTAVRAFDSDAAVPHVLRAEPDYFATARRGLQRELHDQPLLRSKRPVCAVLLDFGVGPGVMALGLELDAGNARGGVVLAHRWHG